MPSIKKEHKVKTKRYLALKQTSGEMKEKGDCGVISLAAVTGKSYKRCHAALAKLGREPQKGTTSNDMAAAAKALGFRFTEVPIQDFLSQYPKPHCNLKNISTHHPARFPDVWDDGRTYLLGSARHWTGVVNGMVHDWAKGRQLQMHTVYKVTAIIRRKA